MHLLLHPDSKTYSYFTINTMIYFLGPIYECSILKAFCGRDDSGRGANINKLASHTCSVGTLILAVDFSKLMYWGPHGIELAAS
jgi:hypothetical protein